MTGDIAVPLRSRRQQRALLMQKLQHVVPAFALLLGATQTLRGGPHGFELALAVGEIAICALLVATFARSAKTTFGPRKAAAGHHAHGVDWVDIFIAGVLFAEAAEHWNLHHRVKGPTILLAFVTLGIGLLHPRLSKRRERRRSLRLTADHLTIGGKPFRKFTAAWGEIVEVNVTERQAEIRTRDGRRRRVNLSDLDNADEVRAALLVAQKRLALTP